MACVMLCFVWMLVFCCVAGGQGPDHWSNNTSLKNSSWGSYGGMDRTERCESSLGAPFISIWVPAVYDTSVYLVKHIVFCWCVSLMNHSLARESLLTCNLFDSYVSHMEYTLAHVSHMKHTPFATCVSVMKHCLWHVWPCLMAYTRAFQKVSDYIFSRGK
jgi:hypothetical protein